VFGADSLGLAKLVFTIRLFGYLLGNARDQSLWRDFKPVTVNWKKWPKLKSSGTAT